MGRGGADRMELGVRIEEKPRRGTGRTELPAPKDDDVPRLGVDLHLAPSLLCMPWMSCAESIGRIGEQECAHLSGDTSGAEEASVLVHVKRSAAHGVGLEHARTEVMNEPERGHDERRRAGELLPSIGSRIVPVEREKGEGEKKTRRE